VFKNFLQYFLCTQNLFFYFLQKNFFCQSGIFSIYASSTKKIEFVYTKIIFQRVIIKFFFRFWFFAPRPSFKKFFAILFVYTKSIFYFLQKKLFLPEWHF